METDKNHIKNQVKQSYGSIAQRGNQGCGDGCCSPNPQGKTSILSIHDISTKLGYSSSDLEGMPNQANMGLGCGNPIAMASLKEGETVLDLGSGGGFDCFLARKQVKETGQVIGVDMTPAMIDLARKNSEQLGYKNVEFRLGEIEHLPIENDSIDVIISNCVINLSPDKPKVFQEAFRVLKHGGRVSISDICATAQLPTHIKEDLKMYTGCIAGAEETSTIETILMNTGFVDINIYPKDNSKEILKSWVPDKKVEDFVASFIIEARKP
jgi:arsenite methyltransferase